MVLRQSASELDAALRSLMCDLRSESPIVVARQAQQSTAGVTATRAEHRQRDERRQSSVHVTVRRATMR